MMVCIDLKLVCGFCNRLWLQKKRTTFVNRGSSSRKEEVDKKMKMWILRIVISPIFKRAGRRRHGLGILVNKIERSWLCIRMTKGKYGLLFVEPMVGPQKYMGPILLNLWFHLYQAK
jgi:hypothetical protein